MEVLGIMKVGERYKYKIKQIVIAEIVNAVYSGKGAMVINEPGQSLDWIKIGEEFPIVIQAWELLPGQGKASNENN